MPSVYTITTSFQTYSGGVGYNMTGQVVYNDSTITGGLGGPGAYRVEGGSGYTTDGGIGGAGVVLSAGTLTNNDVIRGGAGGYGTATAGNGGVGVRLTGSGVVTNDGKIYGGAGGYGAPGGYIPGAPEMAAPGSICPAARSPPRGLSRVAPVARIRTMSTDRWALRFSSVPMQAH
jgi:hypothetical protein